MKLRHLAVALVVGALSLVLVTAALGAKKPAPPKDQTFFGTLLGKNEVNPVTSKKRAGDRDGRGGATAVIEGKQFCFGIVVKNIDRPTQAHVHRGRPGVNGPIVITLDPPASGDPGASSGCVDVDDSSLLGAIKRNPHNYYFNVHTDAFPSGAIRGQIFSKRN